MMSSETESKEHLTSGAQAPPRYPIESVDNALQILLLFEESPSLRLTDVSQYLGVASSTAHRLLSMLQYRGFAQQNPATKAYEPGPALRSIAFLTMARLDVTNLVRPVLNRLHEVFDETVHFGRLGKHTVDFLVAVESTRAVRVSSRVGRSLPLHATSTGKAMLSLLEREALRQLYRYESLEAITPKTLTSLAALERVLDGVRERGFATSDEESEDGVVSVAVPVRSKSGEIFGLNVSVPKHRMTLSLQEEIATELKRASTELAAKIV